MIRERIAPDALLRVINDVLDLSKAESNQMVLERIPFEHASRSVHLPALWRQRRSGCRCVRALQG
ncbi:hypothetical protein WL30_00270 [Burkholderia ubonensis]|nr:hypothetical protein WL30_00270 [Burkholderia ubonensis]KWB28118.1 hypothetical protein WL31_30210 [Burkholderia ubonensis]